MTVTIVIPNGVIAGQSLGFEIPASTVFTVPIPISDGQLIIGDSLGNPVAATLSASNGITVTNGPGSIALSFNASNVTDPYTPISFADSPYTVLPTDYFISVDCSGGPVSIVFPDTLVNHKSWVVKDRLGNATTNNITISTTGGFTIDGSATYTILKNYVSIELLLAGTNFEVF